MNTLHPEWFLPTEDGRKVLSEEGKRMAEALEQGLEVTITRPAKRRKATRKTKAKVHKTRKGGRRSSKKASATPAPKVVLGVVEVPSALSGKEAQEPESTWWSDASPPQFDFGVLDGGCWHTVGNDWPVEAEGHYDHPFLEISPFAYNRFL